MFKRAEPCLVSITQRWSLQILQFVIANAVAASAPINDNFADRIVLPGAPVSVMGNSADGTLEAGEPPVYHEFSTVWYQWTAGEQGNVKIRIPDSPSMIAEVYRGNTLAELRFLARVNSSQDADVDVVAGAVYQFRISATHYTPFPRLDGPFTLSLEYNAAPVNDHFINRIRLTNAVERVFFRNLLATLEPGETSVASAGGGHSIGYEWRPPANGEAHLRLGDAASVGVYAGSESGRGSLIASNVMEGGQSIAETIFDAVAGEIYHLVVDSTGGYPLPDTFFTLTLNGSARLDRLEWASPGIIQMMLVGERSRYYALEVSTNLMEWTALSTNILSDNSLGDYGPPAPAGRFYRVRVVDP